MVKPPTTICEPRFLFLQTKILRKHLHDHNATQQQLDTRLMFLTPTHSTCTTLAGPGFLVLDAWRAMPGWSATVEVLFRGQNAHVDLAGIRLVSVLARRPLVHLSVGHGSINHSWESVSLAATIRKLLWPHLQHKHQSPTQKQRGAALKQEFQQQSGRGCSLAVRCLTSHSCWYGQLTFLTACLPKMAAAATTTTTAATIVAQAIHMRAAAAAVAAKFHVMTTGTATQPLSPSCCISNWLSHSSHSSKSAC